MFDGQSMKRCTKTDGVQSVDRTNVSMHGFIQPDLFAKHLDPSNDSSGLFRRFLLCAPNATFNTLSSIQKLDEKLHYLPHKTWLLIANDETLGKSDIEFEFSEEGHKTYEIFFDEKSHE